MHTRVLVIVDTTAALALYIVGQYYSRSLCGSLKYTDFIMKICSHIFHTIGEINSGNARFRAQSRFDLHSFDQNIVSFENSLF